MNRPKLHHHVPQRYQDGFCRNGLLWVFDRITGKYRQDQPRNVGAITHDYSITTADGKDPRVEELLAQIEDAAKPAFELLRNGQALSDDDKDALACYLGYFFVRGPRFQRMLDELTTIILQKMLRFEMNSVADMTRMIDENPELTAEQRASMNPDAMYLFVKSEQYSARVNREEGVRMMVEQGLEMRNYFRQMDWLVLHAPPTTAFLTTDNPLVVVPPFREQASIWLGSSGVITPGAIKVFPLAHDSCLLMLDHGDYLRHTTATRDAVRMTNLQVVGRCERLVLGRDEAHVRSVVQKTGVDRDARPPIFKTPHATDD